MTHLTRRARFLISLLAVVAAFGTPPSAHAEKHVVTARLHHLRGGDRREWDTFPKESEGDRLEVRFSGRTNKRPATLHVRQQDVKQRWQVKLNEQSLGRLVVDENDMLLCFDVPAGVLIDGENLLTVTAEGRHRLSDDIRVGEITLDDRPREEALGECTLAMRVREDGSKSDFPCRVTVVSETGTLPTFATVSNDEMAIRPGVAFTSTGRAELKLPAGSYTVYAGRGFEYSLSQSQVTIKPGERKQIDVSLTRQVDTSGWISCDTHVHTRTHSGHGDSTVQERMITLAAEGIELPIATDHNVHIDHDPFARSLRVRKYFTPVIGNEVTTKTGHFNIFPVKAGSPIPDFKSNIWKTTLDNIFATPGVKVAILNHARDAHGGTTPFGPKHFNEAAGEMLDDWHVGFNAMEIVNSGATQSDPLELTRDWMTLLNRGRSITPVGSSDSHDVARHFVGQGRTYIRADDRAAGKIDVSKAVQNFLQGRVMVSYGLLAEMKVNDKFGAGEVAAISGKKIKVDVSVLGPHWVHADRLQLFANGILVKDVEIGSADRQTSVSGLIYKATWNLPTPKHDVHLVALATGPGIESLYWRTAKPYQPNSMSDRTRTLGCSGAIWLDVDKDGRGTAASDYASKIVRQSDADPDKVFRQLASYDQAVATQAALLLDQAGHSPLSLMERKSFAAAKEPVRQGITAYLEAWRENQLARGSN